MIYQREYRRLRKLNGGKKLGKWTYAKREEGKGLSPEEFSKHLSCIRCHEIGCVRAEEAYCATCWAWIQNYGPVH